MDSGNILKIELHTSDEKGDAEGKDNIKQDSGDSIWGHPSTCTAPVEPEQVMSQEQGLGTEPGFQTELSIRK